jgi:predicted AAA+ superfamily ATPase
VGKSTLVRALAEGKWKARYTTLDDRAVLDLALTDPDRFIHEIRLPAVIDEVQRAPDLLRAIKVLVDKDRRPGMFLLTGSANLLTLPKVSESLAGRMAVFDLHPLSWTEWKRNPAGNLISRLFGAEKPSAVLEGFPSSVPDGRHLEWKTALLRGGFPQPALESDDEARRTWFEGYRRSYVERDLRDVAEVLNLPEFNKLLAVVAMRTGTTLNMSELSRDIGLPYETLRRYFNLLQQSYQLFLLQPYASNRVKRLVRTPKLYLGDTGFACHLSVVDRWETLVRQERAGALLETWVASEIRKALALDHAATGLYYWRAQGGAEVDFLIERGSDIVAIEVKLSHSARKDDFRGLESARAFFGKRWRCGVILYGGSRPLAADDRTLLLPYSLFFGRDGGAVAETRV